MDFTLKTFEIFIKALIEKGYFIYSLQKGYPDLYIDKILFRHDVDLYPDRALAMAQLENRYGIKGSYYFRNVKASWDERIITAISEMGHEVGYHYEDFAFARQKTKGKRQKGLPEHYYERELAEIAIESFSANLKRLRKHVAVKTICMHGSPMSRWDSRLLWKYYDYQDFGIQAEPYFDFNMEEMLYLTDTGRRWNGESVSVRDKGFSYAKEPVVKAGQAVKFEIEQNSKPGTLNVEPFSDWVRKPIPGSLMNMNEESQGFQGRYKFRSTNDIILAAKRGKLPDRLMMTFHPQRWIDKPFPWMKELAWQNVKNVGKYFLIKLKN